MGVYSLILIMGKLTLGKYMIEILCTFQNVNRVKSETVREAAGRTTVGNELRRSGMGFSNHWVLAWTKCPFLG